MFGEIQNHPLTISLQAGVPLKIIEMRERGGPDAADYARAQAFSHELAEHGDILMFKGGKPGETAKLWGGLVHAIAVLSFAPGGIHIFGQHWEAHKTVV